MSDILDDNNKSIEDILRTMEQSAIERDKFFRSGNHDPSLYENPRPIIAPSNSFSEPSALASGSGSGQSSSGPPSLDLTLPPLGIDIENDPVEDSDFRFVDNVVSSVQDMLYQNGYDVSLPELAIVYRKVSKDLGTEQDDIKALSFLDEIQTRTGLDINAMVGDDYISTLSEYGYVSDDYVVKNNGSGFNNDEEYQNFYNEMNSDLNYSPGELPYEGVFVSKESINPGGSGNYSKDVVLEDHSGLYPALNEKYKVLKAKVSEAVRNGYVTENELREIQDEWDKEVDATYNFMHSSDGRKDQRTQRASDLKQYLTAHTNSELARIGTRKHLDMMHANNEYRKLSRNTTELQEKYLEKYNMPSLSDISKMDMEKRQEVIGEFYNKLNEERIKDNNPEARKILADVRIMQGTQSLLQGMNSDYEGFKASSQNRYDNGGVGTVIGEQFTGDMKSGRAALSKQFNSPVRNIMNMFSKEFWTSEGLANTVGSFAGAILNSSPTNPTPWLDNETVIVNMLGEQTPEQVLSKSGTVIRRDPETGKPIVDYASRELLQSSIVAVEDDVVFPNSLTKELDMYLFETGFWGKDGRVVDVGAELQREMTGSSQWDGKKVIAIGGAAAQEKNEKKAKEEGLKYDNSVDFAGSKFYIEENGKIRRPTKDERESIESKLTWGSIKKTEETYDPVEGIGATTKALYTMAEPSIIDMAIALSIPSPTGGITTAAKVSKRVGDVKGVGSKIKVGAGNFSKRAYNRLTSWKGQTTAAYFMNSGYLDNLNETYNTYGVTAEGRKAARLMSVFEAYTNVAIGGVETGMTSWSFGSVMSAKKILSGFYSGSITRKAAGRMLVKEIPELVEENVDELLQFPLKDIAYMLADADKNPHIRREVWEEWDNLWVGATFAEIVGTTTFSTLGMSGARVGSQISAAQQIRNSIGLNETSIASLLDKNDIDNVQRLAEEFAEKGNDQRYRDLGNTLAEFQEEYNLQETQEGKREIARNIAELYQARQEMEELKNRTATESRSAAHQQERKNIFNRIKEAENRIKQKGVNPREKRHEMNRGKEISMFSKGQVLSLSSDTEMEEIVKQEDGSYIPNGSRVTEQKGRFEVIEDSDSTGRVKVRNLDDQKTYTVSTTTYTNEAGVTTYGNATNFDVVRSKEYEAEPVVERRERSDMAMEFYQDKIAELEAKNDRSSQEDFQLEVLKRKANEMNAAVNPNAPKLYEGLEDNDISLDDDVNNGTISYNNARSIAEKIKAGEDLTDQEVEAMSTTDQKSMTNMSIAFDDVGVNMEDSTTVLYEKNGESKARSGITFRDILNLRAMDPAKRIEELEKLGEENTKALSNVKKKHKKSALRQFQSLDDLMGNGLTRFANERKAVTKKGQPKMTEISTIELEADIDSEHANQDRRTENSRGFSLSYRNVEIVPDGDKKTRGVLDSTNRHRAKYGGTEADADQNAQRSKEDNRKVSLDKKSRFADGEAIYLGESDVPGMHFVLVNGQVIEVEESRIKEVDNISDRIGIPQEVVDGIEAIINDYFNITDPNQARSLRNIIALQLNRIAEAEEMSIEEAWEKFAVEKLKVDPKKKPKKIKGTKKKSAKEVLKKLMEDNTFVSYSPVTNDISEGITIDGWVRQEPSYVSDDGEVVEGNFYIVQANSEGNVVIDSGLSGRPFSEIGIMAGDNTVLEEDVVPVSDTGTTTEGPTIDFNEDSGQFVVTNPDGSQSFYELNENGEFVNSDATTQEEIPQEIKEELELFATALELANEGKLNGVDQDYVKSIALELGLKPKQDDGSRINEGTQGVQTGGQETNTTRDEEEAERRKIENAPKEDFVFGLSEKMDTPENRATMVKIYDSMGVDPRYLEDTPEDNAIKNRALGIFKNNINKREIVGDVSTKPQEEMTVNDVASTLTPVKLDGKDVWIFKTKDPRKFSIVPIDRVDADGNKITVKIKTYGDPNAKLIDLGFFGGNPSVDDTTSPVSEIRYDEESNKLTFVKDGNTYEFIESVEDSNQNTKIKAKRTDTGKTVMLVKDPIALQTIANAAMENGIDNVSEEVEDAPLTRKDMHKALTAAHAKYMKEAGLKDKGNEAAKASAALAMHIIETINDKLGLDKDDLSRISFFTDGSKDAPAYKIGKGKARRDRKIEINLAKTGAETALPTMAGLFLETAVNTNERAKVLKALGAKKLDAAAIKKFQDGFMDYVRTKKAPSTLLGKLYAKFADAIKAAVSLFDSVSATPNKSLIDIYDQMIMGVDAAKDRKARYDAVRRVNSKPITRVSGEILKPEDVTLPEGTTNVDEVQLVMPLNVNEENTEVWEANIKLDDGSYFRDIVTVDKVKPITSLSSSTKTPTSKKDQSKSRIEDEGKFLADMEKKHGLTKAQLLNPFINLDTEKKENVQDQEDLDALRKKKGYSTKGLKKVSNEGVTKRQADYDYGITVRVNEANPTVVVVGLVGKSDKAILSPVEMEIDESMLWVFQSKNPPMGVIPAIVEGKFRERMDKEADMNRVIAKKESLKMKSQDSVAVFEFKKRETLENMGVSTIDGKNVYSDPMNPSIVYITEGVTESELDFLDAVMDLNLGNVSIEEVFGGMKSATEIARHSDNETVFNEAVAKLAEMYNIEDYDPTSFSNILKSGLFATEQMGSMERLKAMKAFIDKSNDAVDIHAVASRFGLNQIMWSAANALFGANDKNGSFMDVLKYINKTLIPAMNKKGVNTSEIINGYMAEAIKLVPRIIQDSEGNLVPLVDSTAEDNKPTLNISQEDAGYVRGDLKDSYLEAVKARMSSMGLDPDSDTYKMVVDTIEKNGIPMTMSSFAVGLDISNFTAEELGIPTDRLDLLDKVQLFQQHSIAYENSTRLKKKARVTVNGARYLEVLGLIDRYIHMVPDSYIRAYKSSGYFLSKELSLEMDKALQGIDNPSDQDILLALTNIVDKSDEFNEVVSEIVDKFDNDKKTRAKLGVTLNNIIDNAKLTKAKATSEIELSDQEKKVLGSYYEFAMKAPGIIEGLNELKNKKNPVQKRRGKLKGLSLDNEMNLKADDSSTILDLMLVLTTISDNKGRLDGMAASTLKDFGLPVFDTTSLTEETGQEFGLLPGETLNYENIERYKKGIANNTMDSDRTDKIIDFLIDYLNEVNTAVAGLSEVPVLDSTGLSDLKQSLTNAIGNGMGMDGTSVQGLKEYISSVDPSDTDVKSKLKNIVSEFVDMNGQTVDSDIEFARSQAVDSMTSVKYSNVGQVEEYEGGEFTIETPAGQLDFSSREELESYQAGVDYALNPDTTNVLNLEDGNMLLGYQDGMSMLGIKIEQTSKGIGISNVTGSVLPTSLIDGMGVKRVSTEIEEDTTTQEEETTTQEPEVIESGENVEGIFEAVSKAADSYRKTRGEDKDNKDREFKERNGKSIYEALKPLGMLTNEATDQEIRDSFGSEDGDILVRMMRAGESLGNRVFLMRNDMKYTQEIMDLLMDWGVTTEGGSLARFTSYNSGFATYGYSVSLPRAAVHEFGHGLHNVLEVISGSDLGVSEEAIAVLNELAAQISTLISNREIVINKEGLSGISRHLEISSSLQTPIELIAELYSEMQKGNVDFKFKKDGFLDRLLDFVNGLISSILPDYKGMTKEELISDASAAKDFLSIMMDVLNSDLLNKEGKLIEALSYVNESINSKLDELEYRGEPGRVSTKWLTLTEVGPKIKSLINKLHDQEVAKERKAKDAEIEEGTTTQEEDTTTQYTPTDKEQKAIDNINEAYDEWSEIDVEDAENEVGTYNARLKAIKSGMSRVRAIVKAQPMSDAELAELKSKHEKEMEDGTLDPYGNPNSDIASQIHSLELEYAQQTPYRGEDYTEANDELKGIIEEYADELSEAKERLKELKKDRNRNVSKVKREYKKLSDPAKLLASYTLGEMGLEDLIPKDLKQTRSGNTLFSISSNDKSVDLPLESIKVEANEAIEESKINAEDLDNKYKTKQGESVYDSVKDLGMITNESTYEEIKEVYGDEADGVVNMIKNLNLLGKRFFGVKPGTEVNQSQRDLLLNWGTGSILDMPYFGSSLGGWSNDVSSVSSKEIGFAHHEFGHDLHIAIEVAASTASVNEIRAELGNQILNLIASGELLISDSAMNEISLHLTRYEDDAMLAPELMAEIRRRMYTGEIELRPKKDGAFSKLIDFVNDLISYILPDYKLMSKEDLLSNNDEAIMFLSIMADTAAGNKIGESGKLREALNVVGTNLENKIEALRELGISRDDKEVGRSVNELFKPVFEKYDAEIKRLEEEKKREEAEKKNKEREEFEKKLEKMSRLQAEISESKIEVERNTDGYTEPELKKIRKNSKSLVKIYDEIAELEPRFKESPEYKEALADSKIKIARQSKPTSDRSMMDSLIERMEKPRRRLKQTRSGKVKGTFQTILNQSGELEKALVKLGPDADATTIIHELSHWYMDAVKRNDSKKYNEIKERYGLDKITDKQKKKYAKKYGLKKYNEETVLQELWADTVEAAFLYNTINANYVSGDLDEVSKLFKAAYEGSKDLEGAKKFDDIAELLFGKRKTAADDFGGIPKKYKKSGDVRPGRQVAFEAELVAEDLIKGLIQKDFTEAEKQDLAARMGIEYDASVDKFFKEEKKGKKTTKVEVPASQVLASEAQFKYDTMSSAQLKAYAERKMSEYEIPWVVEDHLLAEAAFDTIIMNKLFDESKGLTKKGSDNEIQLELNRVLGKEGTKLYVNERNEVVYKDSNGDERSWTEVRGNLESIDATFSIALDNMIEAAFKMKAATGIDIEIDLNPDQMAMERSSFRAQQEAEAEEGSDKRPLERQDDKRRRDTTIEEQFQMYEDTSEGETKVVFAVNMMASSNATSMDMYGSFFGALSLMGVDNTVSRLVRRMVAEYGLTKTTDEDSSDVLREELSAFASAIRAAGSAEANNSRFLKLRGLLKHLLGKITGKKDSSQWEIERMAVVFDEKLSKAIDKEQSNRTKGMEGLGQYEKKSPRRMLHVSYSPVSMGVRQVVAAVRRQEANDLPLSTSLLNEVERHFGKETRERLENDPSNYRRRNILDARNWMKGSKFVEDFRFNKAKSFILNAENLGMSEEQIMTALEARGMQDVSSLAYFFATGKMVESDYIGQIDIEGDMGMNMFERFLAYTQDANFVLRKIERSIAGQMDQFGDDRSIYARAELAAERATQINEGIARDILGYVSSDNVFAKRGDKEHLNYRKIESSLFAKMERDGVFKEANAHAHLRHVPERIQRRIEAYDVSLSMIGQRLSDIDKALAEHEGSEATVEKLNSLKRKENERKTLIQNNINELKKAKELSEERLARNIRNIIEELGQEKMDSILGYLKEFDDKVRIPALKRKAAAGRLSKASYEKLVRGGRSINRSMKGERVGNALLPEIERSVDLTDFKNFMSLSTDHNPNDLLYSGVLDEEGTELSRKGIGGRKSEAREEGLIKSMVLYDGNKPGKEDHLEVMAEYEYKENNENQPLSSFVARVLLETHSTIKNELYRDIAELVELNAPGWSIRESSMSKDPNVLSFVKNGVRYDLRQVQMPGESRAAFKNRIDSKNGLAQWIRIENREQVKSLYEMGAGSKWAKGALAVAVRGLVRLNQQTRMTVTQLDPSFSARNAYVDYRATALNRLSKELKDKGIPMGTREYARMQADFSKALAKAYATEFKYRFGEGGELQQRRRLREAEDDKLVEASSQMDKYREEAVENGMMLTWSKFTREYTSYISSSGNRNTSFDKIKEQVDKRDKDRKSSFSSVTVALDEFGQMAETATRLASYAVARQYGLTAMQSAHVGRSVTVNFSRKGSLAKTSVGFKTWLQGQMFMNVAIQGLVYGLHRQYYEPAVDFGNRVAKSRSNQGNNLRAITSESIDAFSETILAETVTPMMFSIFLGVLGGLMRAGGEEDEDNSTMTSNLELVANLRKKYAPNVGSINPIGITRIGVYEENNASTMLAANDYKINIAKDRGYISAGQDSGWNIARIIRSEDSNKAAQIMRELAWSFLDGAITELAMPNDKLRSGVVSTVVPSEATNLLQDLDKIAGLFTRGDDNDDEYKFPESRVSLVSQKMYEVIGGNSKGSLELVKIAESLFTRTIPLLGTMLKGYDTYKYLTADESSPDRQRYKSRGLGIDTSESKHQMEILRGLVDDIASAGTNSSFRRFDDNTFIPRNITMWTGVGSEERTKDLTIAMTKLKGVINSEGGKVGIRETSLVDQYFKHYYQSDGISEKAWKNLLLSTFSDERAKEYMEKYREYHGKGN